MSKKNWSVLLDPSEITVNRDARQRKEVGDVTDLAESIKRNTQLQPIVINRNNELVAGERRLTAIRSLPGFKVKCVYVDEVDPAELHLLEFEENAKRKDLDWRDKQQAIVNYHELKSKNDPEWSAASTAQALNMAAATVSNAFAIVREMRSGNTMVKEAPKLSTAVGIVKRAAERRRNAEVKEILNMSSVPPVSTEEAEGSEGMREILAGLKKSSGFILNEDFKYWAESYAGPKFNLIHCDFPYGVGMHNSDQGSGDSYGVYEDTPEIYWGLIDTLLNNLDNFCDEQAHILFWFSMDYYTETMRLLSREFRINPFPLIWVKSDNSGILPDSNRGPRRTYETAFLGSRGDRKIVRPVSNHIASPIQRGRHMSEKPQAVLGHFFRMLVDPSSSVLDPTCGSGSAIRAAITAGATNYLGLEINSEFAASADETLVNFLEAQEINGTT